MVVQGLANVGVAVAYSAGPKFRLSSTKPEDTRLSSYYKKPLRNNHQNISKPP